jgi:ATP-dependent 26S proteasome regulatory subunit
MARHRKHDTGLFYQDNFEHLRDELRQLDLLIHMRVQQFRRWREESEAAAASSPLFIAREFIDWLFCRDEAPSGGSPEVVALRRQLEARHQDIAAKQAGSLARGTFLALPSLAQRFGLSPFEVQTLVICLAPELQRKYDQFYAYLQDDITRKKPSVDLVLDLLCESENTRWYARTLFADNGALIRWGLLHKTEDRQSPSGSSGLAQFLKLDQSVLQYILGNYRLDGRVTDVATLLHPTSDVDQVLIEPTLKAQVQRLVQSHLAQPPTETRSMALYFQGPYGAGQRELALALCGGHQRPLLYLDLGRLLARENDVTPLLRLVGREALLQGAALFFDRVDMVWQEGGQAQALMPLLARVIEESGGLTFLAGEHPWSLKALLQGVVFHTLLLPVPDVPVRQDAWQRSLGRLSPQSDPTWPARLASQFRLTPGQILDAAAWAENTRIMRGGSAELTLADLYAACRDQSNQKLAELALKIDPRYSWEDIVLPADRLDQLKEICSQVTHRYRVFGEWGFDRKLSHGKGLSVLFAGLSGTGKTMAAEVMAHDLQVDLYKIDLSAVVSKYIGDTEKNLSRIFQEAETSNAVLFFDEADALFGKRTEVSDAHDRYANIETSYLLQKMEEYEGIVILATNLRENLDDAFIRRMRFIVEFPFPDATSRQKIWLTHFPSQAPVSPDIDYAWLARQFQVTGGHIKNIVLNAAFFAAANGGVIGMEQVLRGAKREFEKIGKLWNDTYAAPTQGRG